MQFLGSRSGGKTTFLKAYNFFVEPKQTAQLHDFLNHDLKNKIEIEAIYTVSPDEDKKDKSLGKEDPEWINKWVTTENEIKIKKTWNNIGEIGVKNTFDPKQNKYVDGGFGGFDTLLKKYSPSAIEINAVLTIEDLEKSINDIITKNHIKKLETTYKDTYEKLINGIQKLKEDISKSSDILEINNKMNDFFSRIFPKFEVSIYPLPDEGIDLTKTLKSTHGLLVHEKEKQKKDIDLKLNGHGVIRQAFFSFLSTYQNEIIGSDKQYIILFEEPELYLHPEAIYTLRRQLYDLSKNSPYQIMCATHAPLMIDLSEHHSSLIRLVKNEDTEITKTYQVDFNAFDSEEKEKLQMINRFNPHICEAFFSDQAILVEGDTEAIIYRTLIDKFYLPNKYFILNTGSKSNIQFYQKILTHFGIKHVIVHDCDEREYIDKNKKKKINPMFTVNENIWKEIENSNSIHPFISRRYTHYLNFENAHGYEHDEKLGKPLSAFKFADSIEKDLKYPCIEFLNDLFSKNEINHDQDYLLKLYI
ncbi:ATP-dependent nuclease [Leptospira yanagawae]|uniref:ATP-dependent nuclease n=1 Tax=Leptospira yanagawae TaxID=293069 RepID=UPI00068575F4|nr:AAA family ATPase [Leptospira yanagawae]